MKDFSYLKLVTAILLIATSIFAASALIHATDYTYDFTMMYGQNDTIFIPCDPANMATNNSQSTIYVDGKWNYYFTNPFIPPNFSITVTQNLTYTNHVLSFNSNRNWPDTYYCNLFIKPWSTKINTGLDIILNKDTEDLTHVLTCSLVNASSNQPISGANISFNFNNKNLSTITDEYGIAYFDFSSLAVGNYTGRIEYAGNDSFASSLATMNVEIDGAVPFDTGIIIDSDYYFNGNNSTNAKIGQLQANINGINQSLVDKDVTLVMFNSTGETGRFTGITDSNGFCTFDISSLPVGDYEAFITFIGDSITYYGCTTPDFKIHMDEAPVPPEPTPIPTPVPDTNDTNTTNDTVNDTNISIAGSIAGSIDSLLEPFEELPVTGTDAFLFGALACLAVLVYVKRK